MDQVTFSVFRIPYCVFRSSLRLRNTALLRKVCAIWSRCGLIFDAEEQRSKETEFFSAFLRETLRSSFGVAQDRSVSLRVTAYGILANMTHPDSLKWNKRYAEEGQRWLDSPPRDLLLAYLSHLPSSGLALDGAAGVGVNGLVLARRGLHVVALDIAEVGLRLARTQALQEGVGLETAVYDLSQPWFPPHSFDVILNFRFLERATFPIYRQALKPGGWLLFETFIRTPGTESEADYYLLPGELEAAFVDFELVHSEETTGVKPTASLVARKGPV